MFAYCENNPVMRSDSSGEVFDTIFDVISLGMSIADVAANPHDPLAWAGLVGDVIDVAVPCVSGVGEIVRGVSGARKAVKTVDNVKDTVKASERAAAVRKAWKNEFNNVKAGGTGISREWSHNEINELLTNGKVKGYQGHHMKSVKGYPHLAGDPTNIQFLTRQEHLAAHGGNWRNVTHGRYHLPR